MSCLQMREPLWYHMREQFLAHMRTSNASAECGKFVMVDGHAKVFRSHCCARTPLTPQEEERSGEFLYSQGFYCPEIPDRQPTSRGLCKGHLLQLKQQTASQSSTIPTPSVEHISEYMDRDTRDEVEDEANNAATIDSSFSRVPVPSVLRYRTRAVTAALQDCAAEKVLSCKMEGQQVYYLVQWQGKTAGASTWELEADVPAAVLAQFRQHSIPSTFYTSLSKEQELLRQPEDDTPDDSIPEQHLPAARRAKGARQRLPFQHCSARSGQEQAERTFGEMVAMCPCGMKAPPWELVGAESCTEVSSEPMHVYLNS